MKRKNIFCINPHCLEIFPENKALFVCYSCNHEQKCEKSGIHFDHSNNYFVFEGISKLPWYMKMLGVRSISQCPKCNKVNIQRACPKCHSELIGETENGFEESNFITMVGAPSSGKTAWFYSLKHHLAEIARQTKIQCIPYLATNTWLQKMDNQFRDYGRLSPTTNLEFSLVYRITTSFSKKSIYLVLPDPEGEIYINPNKDKLLRLLLSRAEAIFYFINPLSIPKVGHGLKTKISVDLPSSPQQDLILAKVYQLLSEISDTKIKTIPIAVIVTHTDILFDLLKDEYEIDILDYATKPYNGSYFPEIYNKISDLCKNFLDKAGLGNFVLTVEREFKIHSFFFTGANNEDPRVWKSSGPPYSIRPFRVVDPLLWILWIYKYIPEAKL